MKYHSYSENDLVLALVYRYERWKVKVAGICAVPYDGVENVNLSEIIDKHTDYLTKMKQILEIVDLLSCYSVVNSASF